MAAYRNLWYSVMLFAGCIFVAPASRAADKEELRESILAYRASLPSFAYEAHLTVDHVYLPDGETPRADRSITRIRRMGEYAYFEKLYFEKDNAVPFQSRSGMQNPEYGAMYFKEENQGQISDSYAKAIVGKDFLSRQLLWSHPLDTGAVLLTDLAEILAYDGTRVVGEEVLFGTTMIKLEVDQLFAIWIDPEHGGLPRRVDRYDGNAIDPANLQIRYEIPELHIIRGIPFPARMTEELFRPREPDGPKKPYARVEQVLPLEGIRLGTLTESDFEFTFPDGVSVIDGRSVESERTAQNNPVS